MPMRSELHIRETTAQREGMAIGEVLVVVIFCLAGFTVSIFAAEHSPLFSEWISLI
jgi:hypothetical protein